VRPHDLQALGGRLRGQLGLPALCLWLALGACASQGAGPAAPPSAAAPTPAPASAPKISPAPEPKARVPGGPVIAVTATPIEIAGRLQGVTLASAVRLSAEPAEFGGFSGLEIDAGRLVAVTDQGWLLDAEIEIGAGGLALTNARLSPLRDRRGRALRRKSASDAEALAIRPGRTMIAFERDHRITDVAADGRLGTAIRARLFERLRSNSGLEALAALPDGRLLAIAEGESGTPSPVFLIAPDGRIAAATLPSLSRHSVTGADIGPDGRLYLVLRHYSPLLGVSARVRRYDLDARGLPVPGTVAELAAFDRASGIDNMEGIAVWQDGTGRTHLTLISDDNFSVLQRTILVDLLID